MINWNNWLNFWMLSKFPDTPCMKSVAKTNRRPYICLQPGMKSGCRPTDKLFINTLSTAGQPRVLFFLQFTWEFLCSCLHRNVQDILVRCPGCTKKVCVLPEQNRSCPTLPSPPQPAAWLCAARPDPPVVCPGFGFYKSRDHDLFVEAKTRTYHRQAGSGRTAGQPGGVRQDRLPTELFAKATSVPRTLQGIEDTLPERSPRDKKKDPMATDCGNKSTSWWAVYVRFSRGTRSALCFWLLTSGPMLFCRCKPFWCRAFPEKVHTFNNNELSNSKHGHSAGGLVGAANSEAGGLGGPGKTGLRLIIWSQKQQSLAPTDSRKNLLWKLLLSSNVFVLGVNCLTNQANVRPDVVDNHFIFDVSLLDYEQQTNR